ncbi:hypothetical protein F0562_028928 [Nyssa sinensis]|uniref:Glycosyltransferase N-terminal domain-containing protein n=1 Tax=Nyssa sinensis TaxID=561372 RepID=A0A5J5B1M9_9ASTE|nr:hypothetical protein F0562_028928 [Nyssa sinensis]
MGSIPAASDNKPHAVCIPYPAQGHINPMLKLSKLLHYRGFHITFVNTEYNHKRLLKSRGPNSLDGLPDFRFETIPDGLPPSDADATQDIPSLCESTSKTCLVPFSNLLSKLNDSSSSHIPPVTCIVSDGVMSFTLKAAEKLGIPEVLFWTTSACGFLGYRQYRHLIERGLAPLKDASRLTNGYLDTTIDWIPGMKNIRLRDLPSFIRTTDSNDFMFHFLKTEADRAFKASAVVLNTFDIITVMTKQQLTEFAWGLANSKKSFLWIIRPDIVSGDSAILPPEIVSETKERGMLANWCPQEQVLKHPAIGGFLTHNGWNSTIESICSGVPVICWPFFAEQQTNCRYSCIEWGIGMEIDSDVKRDEVEKLVRELMNGEKGKEMKKKVMDWKKKAEEAIGQWWIFSPQLGQTV